MKQKHVSRNCDLDLRWQMVCFSPRDEGGRHFLRLIKFNTQLPIMSEKVQYNLLLPKMGIYLSQLIAMNEKLRFGSNYSTVAFDLHISNVNFSVCRIKPTIEICTFLKTGLPTKITQPLVCKVNLVELYNPCCIQ